MEQSRDNESIDYNLSAESEIISIKNTKTFMRLAFRLDRRKEEEKLSRKRVFKLLKTTTCHENGVKVDKEENHAPKST